MGAIFESDIQSFQKALLTSTEPMKASRSSIGLSLGKVARSAVQTIDGNSSDYLE